MGPTLTNLRIIWFSLVNAIVIYGILAFFVRVERLPGAGANGPVILALQAAGLVALLAAWFVPGALLRRSRDEAMGGGPPLPATETAIAPKASVALIVRWALLEAVAILGLVAALLGGDPRLFIPFGAVALVAMLLAFPGRGATAA